MYFLFGLVSAILKSNWLLDFVVPLHQLLKICKAFRAESIFFGLVSAILMSNLLPNYVAPVYKVLKIS